MSGVSRQASTPRIVCRSPAGPPLAEHPGSRRRKPDTVVDFGVTQVVDGNWGIHALVKKSLSRRDERTPR